jgi:hypothetical protein
VTTPTSGLSRRALFGLGGATLLAASAATAWRWRTSRVQASPQGRSEGAIPYADHDGWMVSLTEKRALQARTGDSAGGAR